MKKNSKNVPLVLIHGYPFDHTLWYATIASLGAAARVIAPDLPGFGRTEPLDETPSMSAMADWLARYLDEKEVSTAIVAGMSMGGYVALAFAEKYPKNLVGLGLISSQAAGDTEETRKARKEMIAQIKRQGPSAAAVGIAPKLFRKSKPTPPELEIYPHRGAEKAGAQGLTWALEAMAKRQDRTQLVRDLAIPVFIAHGLEDQIVSFQKARTLAEQCRDPLFVELVAGHATPLEAPDQLAQGLARFVRQVQENHQNSQSAPAGA